MSDESCEEFEDVCGDCMDAIRDDALCYAAERKEAFKAEKEKSK